MKKYFLSLFPITIIGLASILSCTSEQEEFLPTPNLAQDIVYASISDDKGDETKVYVDEQLHMLWHSTDHITVFRSNSQNREYSFTGATGDNNGSFVPVESSTASASNEFANNYAVYPYKPETSISESRVITVSLPSSQQYSKGTFGVGASTLVAESSDDHLVFRHAGGVLILKLYGTGIVSSISLKGNNGEKIAGQASVQIKHNDNPSLTMSDDALEEVVLVCETPVEYGHAVNDYAEFWFYLPPVNFSKGISISIYGPDGGCFTKSTSNPVVVSRSRITRMAPIEVDVQDVCLAPPSNQIWYITTNGKVLDPKRTDAFGANLVSNTYIGGVGVMTFDGDVTNIGYESYTSSTQSPFNTCRTLRAIILPSTVRVVCTSAFFNCSNLLDVILPQDELDYLGSGAFSYTCLEEIYIPKTNKVGASPFESLGTLKKVYGPYATEDGRSLIRDGVLWGFAPNGITDYTVPEGVTAIGVRALNNTRLKHINLPSTLQEIYNDAFVGCYYLEEINLPSSLKTIGSSAFYSCESLKSVHIPSSVQSLGSNLFYGCYSLESFSGKYASEDGRLLCVGKSIYAFAPSGLKRYTIPDGLENVYYGFSSQNTLTELEYLTLPSSIKFIVLRSKSLKNLTCLGSTPPSTDGGNYYLYMPSATIFVPKNAVDTYKAKADWNYYSEVTYGFDDDGGVFVVTPTSIPLSGESGTFEVKVVSNVDYHVDVSSNWISELSVSGDAINGRVHTYSVLSNSSGTKRSGVLAFCGDTGVCIPVSVTQEPYQGLDDWVSKSFTHHSLGMRFTATWCSWCPYMNESFIKAKGVLGDRFEYVSLHESSSDLAFSGTPPLASVYGISGYPTGIVDGLKTIANKTDTDAVRDNIVAAVTATESTYPTTVALGISSTLTGRDLEINVDVYPKMTEDYKITVFLLESGVVNYQNNGGANYVHDKIARLSLTDPTGDSFSAESGVVKSLPYAVTIPDNYNIGNMTILAFIQRKFGSQTNIQDGNFGDYYVDNCRVAPLGATLDPEME